MSWLRVALIGIEILGLGFVGVEVGIMLQAGGQGNHVFGYMGVALLALGALLWNKLLKYKPKD